MAPTQDNIDWIVDKQRPNRSCMQNDNEVIHCQLEALDVNCHVQTDLYEISTAEECWSLSTYMEMCPPCAGSIAGSVIAFPNNDCHPNEQEDVDNYMLECHEAVPSYALSHEVFCVDRPKEAVYFGADLPELSITDYFNIGDSIKLFVTEIYSPFQFWFNIVVGHHDVHQLETLNHEMMNFYRSQRSFKWQMFNYFIKSGQVCAVLHELAWRRARIVRTPESEDEDVAIYLLDYGKDVTVDRRSLNFLHRCFAEQPSFAIRGTLTDVYPLDLHWPVKATTRFSQLVIGCELSAEIKEIDASERILFINLFDQTTSISDLLIKSRLAGRSHNYSQTVRTANRGRRLRYLRERLPTFDMLERQVFPSRTEEFEDFFDDIIFAPRFFQQFQPPELPNPLHVDLQEALTRWLLKYQSEDEEWLDKQRDLGE